MGKGARPPAGIGYEFGLGGPVNVTWGEDGELCVQDCWPSRVRRLYTYFCGSSRPCGCTDTVEVDQTVRVTAIHGDRRQAEPSYRGGLGGSTEHDGWTRADVRVRFCL